MKLFHCTAHLIMDVSNTYGYAREPVLARMGDGSLICTFLSGGHTEPEDQNITLAVRSYDDGVTWSSPQVPESTGLVKTSPAGSVLSPEKGGIYDRNFYGREAAYDGCPYLRRGKQIP